MKKLFTLLSVIMLSFSFGYALEKGSVSADPGGSVIDPSNSVTITYNGAGTNFATWAPKCHAHLWLVAKTGETFSKTYTTAWINYNNVGGDPAWNLVPENQKMEKVGSGNTGVYKITIENLLNYFSVEQADKAKIGQLGIIVRTEWDTSGGKNRTENMFLSVNYNEVPSITLSLPASVFLDQTISLNATPSNVDNPVISYSVKVPGSDSFVAATSPYQPSEIGTYTFKAEVAESGDPAVLATDTKNVVVKAVPDPIVIKGKVPESWTNPIHLYVYGTSSDGFKTMTKVGDWYTYTFEYETSVNIVFVNGGDWTGGNANQTVNVENVTASACYQVNNEASGKKTVTQVVCDDDNPSVILTVPALGFVGESIVFDAISSNVDNPVISYFVKVPGSESFVAATSPYQPTEIGTYTFKAEVAESGDPAVLASDTKDVVVHAASSVVVRLKGIPTSWDANDVHVYYWSEGTGDGFRKMDKKEGYYESTFNNKINLGFLFVNGSDWSTEANQSANAGSNVTENTCYKVNEDTDGEGKRTVEAIDCSGIVTGTVSNHLDNFTLSVSNKTITANFAGVSNVELYSMTGQLLQKLTANKQFSQTLNTGIYVLRIDGESHKVVVR